VKASFPAGDGAHPKNAARQAAYRRRHLENADTLDSARLNIVLPVSAKRGLERMARHYAVTQREILIRLIAEAEKEATESMPNGELKIYYGDA